MKNQQRGRSDLERVTHCDDVMRQLWPYLDGELTSRAATSIRIHLRECASCRAFVRFERSFLVGVRAALRGNGDKPHYERRRGSR
jgi:anti-sigma factor RsiW